MHQRFPQISLGGALIKYEKINTNLDFFHVPARGQAAVIFGETLNIFVFNSIVINGVTCIFLCLLLWRMHAQARSS
jgi:hypothetical protein